MIILASTSPTRQAILRSAGLAFTAEAPSVDERQLAARNHQWSPAELAENLACAKAMDVSSRNPAATTIGADQVLACEGVTYNKPRDLEDCRRQLLSLRGRSHRLFSAVACARDHRLQWQTTEIATLHMRNFSESFLDTYLRTYAQYASGSVGGYQIESAGIQLFDDIEGGHFTILGLPLLPLLDYLRNAGIIPA